MTKKNRIMDNPFRQYLLFLLQGVLLASSVYSFAIQDFLTGVLTIGIILLTFIPAFVKKRFEIYMPAAFEVAAVIFVFAGFFLGDLHGFYTRFLWWDVMLHSTSGLLLGIFGFMIVLTMNKDKDIDVKLNAAFIAVFAFMFAVALGALWEIFEFGVDGVLGTAMQKSGLIDTMWDLIIDTIGALIVAIAGFNYIRYEKGFFFRHFLGKIKK
jgi:hypothetical protein